MELTGSLELTRYELVTTELGEERDLDLLLNVTGSDRDASAALQLHLVLNDDLFTYECDRFEDPIF